MNQKRKQNQLEPHGEQHAIVVEDSGKIKLQKKTNSSFFKLNSSKDMHAIVQSLLVHVAKEEK